MNLIFYLEMYRIILSVFLQSFVFFSVILLFKIAEIRFRRDVQQGFVNQLNRAFNIVFMQHFDGGVHVAQRRRNQCRRASVVGVSETVCVGARASAGSVQLYVNLRFFCHV